MKYWENCGLPEIYILPQFIDKNHCQCIFCVTNRIVNYLIKLWNVNISDVKLNYLYVVLKSENHLRHKYPITNFIDNRMSNNDALLVYKIYSLVLEYNIKRYLNLNEDY